MLGLGILSAIALAGIIGYHMVQPNVRDVRLSMAHLMPDPPASQAPKNRFSLRSLINSTRFWLRLLCVGLVALALWPQTLPQAGPEGDTRRHDRLILDISGSMAVQDGGRARIELATEAAAKIHATMQEQQQTSEAGHCIDLVTVAAQAQVHPAVQVAERLTAAQSRPVGGSVTSLVGALTLRGIGDCDGVPTHAVIITDLPEQTVSRERFGGHLMWYQVGAPQDNQAISDVTVLTGTLRNLDPRIALRVTAFGAPPNRVSAQIDGPEGRQDMTLERDPARADSWHGQVPFAGAGRYHIRLPEGGALALDDVVTFEVGELDQVAVDWQLAGLPRPDVLAPPSKGAVTITVAPYRGPQAPLPDGPFVLTYDGWPTGKRHQIGPFMRRHPVLEGVNFDVFERIAPRPFEVGDPQGLNGVIRPDASRGLWVAVRDSPRGVVVPMPTASQGQDVRAVSTLMFFNAVSWVAQAAVPEAPVLTYEGPAGDAVPDATAESDVARALSPSPDLGLLGEPVLEVVQGDVRPQEGQVTSYWMPWLFALAILVLLAERIIGLVWHRRGITDV